MSWFKRIFSGNKPQLMEWPAFAEHYAGRLEAQAGVPVAVMQESGREEAGFVLKFEDGIELNLSVHNRYLNYRENPDGVDEQLEHDIASIHSTLASMRGAGEPMQQAQVLPVIKNQDWGADLPSTAERHIGLPLTGDLMLTFAADSEHSMRYLTQSDISTLGLADIEALYALALSNLAAYAEPRVVLEEYAPGLFQARLDNVYEASLMLFIGALRTQLPDNQLGERVVFAVPARNVLLLCNEGDANALAVMRQVVDEVRESFPHTISEQLYLCDENESIQPFEG